MFSLKRYYFNKILTSEATTTRDNKQEAHGPHRSPENQIQSINKFAHDKIRPQW